MMKTSSVEIVAQLSRMPNTKHLLETFKIDVPYFDQNMLYVVVTGLFIEVYKTNAPTRGFMRTFLLVPQNGGWVIVNDMLYFTTSSVSFEQQHCELDLLMLFHLYLECSIGEV